MDTLGTSKKASIQGLSPLGHSAYPLGLPDYSAMAFIADASTKPTDVGVDPEYQLGEGDPALSPDVGAGVWNSELLEISTPIKRAAIIGILPHATVLIGDDAVKHIWHYLLNTGNDYYIDFENMISDLESGRLRFINEVRQAQQFVKTLPLGNHKITSKKPNGAYARKSENWNWFFAVGGYSTWGKGSISISLDKDKNRIYLMDFEYKFFDRYNWDGGKAVDIFGITVTDHAMGTFHRQGVAREFNMYGSVKRAFKWVGDGVIPDKEIIGDR